MARSLHARGSVAPQPKVQDAADRGERRLRRTAAWLVLYFLMQGETGLAWDRRWHDLVGRDQFWIPPHIMLYSGMGAAGLIALIVVLADTIRYHRGKAGVDADSTIEIFRFFHAPLGFVLLGFGALTDLIAAPFDNYWHELYGIDLTLWSPFHVMGTIGGIIAGLGLAYLFASEAAIERASRIPVRRFFGFTAIELGTLVAISAVMEFILPALTTFIPVTIGSVQIPTYPLPLAIGGAGCLMGVIRLTGKPGAATITALLVWIESVATQAAVPAALNYVVPRVGYTYRFHYGPVFNLTIALIPIIFLVTALVVDGLAIRQQQDKATPGILQGAWLPGLLVGLLATVVPQLLVQLVLAWAPALPPPYDILHILQPQWLDALLILPFALVAGMLGEYLGMFFGDIWHWSRR